MSRRKISKQTIGESRWSDTPDFVDLAKTWKPDAISTLLKLIWEGYDLCSQEVLSKVDISQADDQLEREMKLQATILTVYMHPSLEKQECLVIFLKVFLKQHLKILQ